jgi:hypothetical protein
MVFVHQPVSWMPPQYDTGCLLGVEGASWAAGQTRSPSLDPHAVVHLAHDLAHYQTHCLAHNLAHHLAYC